MGLEKVLWRRGLATNSAVKVAVAMSGGIDSSVAAMILKDQGYNCIGVFMRNWDSSDEAGEVTCSINRDREHMREVCYRLNIPAYDVSRYSSFLISPIIQSSHLTFTSFSHFFLSMTRDICGRIFFSAISKLKFLCFSLPINHTDFYTFLECHIRWIL